MIRAQGFALPAAHRGHITTDEQDVRRLDEADDLDHLRPAPDAKPRARPKRGVAWAQAGIQQPLDRT